MDKIIKYFTLPKIVSYSKLLDSIIIEYDPDKNYDIRNNHYSSIFPNYINMGKHVEFSISFNINTGKIMEHQIYITKVQDLENQTGKTREQIANDILENLLIDGDYPPVRKYRRELTIGTAIITALGLLTYIRSLN